MSNKEQTAGLEPGDQALIIGNLDGWDHDFPVGTKVRLGRFDASDRSWFATGPYGHEQWVSNKDVAPVVDEVTEEELTAAIESIKTTTAQATLAGVSTLQEVLDLQRHDVVAYLDNDNVSFYAGEFCLLSLHPYEVQQQALAALGIRTEAV